MSESMSGTLEHVRFFLNDTEVATEAESSESLLFTLRERLGYYGTKNACEQGECGSCSVLLDDKVVCACLVPMTGCTGRKVTTIEGLVLDPLYKRLEKKFATTGAVQCGFCTPGFIVTALAILRGSTPLTEQYVREQLAGNLCRCTGYSKIVRAVIEVGSEFAENGAPNERS